jgi:hypothetical protein
LPTRRSLLIVTLAGSLAVLATAGLPAFSHATVFHARDEALRLAFPDAERVEARDIILSREQHERIQNLAKAPVDSDLVTIYVGWKNGVPTGYGIFDTHTVRTFPETFLVVISPEGKVVATHILAFHEPLEYLPTQRWLGTFAGKSYADEMRVGGDVAAISGSTLSTHAVTSGIRRALATWRVALGK